MTDSSEKAFSEMIHQPTFIEIDDDLVYPYLLISECETFTVSFWLDVCLGVCWNLIDAYGILHLSGNASTPELAEFQADYLVRSLSDDEDRLPYSPLTESSAFVINVEIPRLAEEDAA